LPKFTTCGKISGQTSPPGPKFTRRLQKM
jgi:hypothetical protein